LDDGAFGVLLVEQLVQPLHLLHSGQHYFFRVVKYSFSEWSNIHFQSGHTFIVSSGQTFFFRVVKIEMRVGVWGLGFGVFRVRVKGLWVGVEG